MYVNVGLEMFVSFFLMNKTPRLLLILSENEKVVTE